MPVAFDEKYLPATLTAAPMGDQEFLDFCAAYPDYLIEATAEGEILIMPPTHWITGARGARILAQLQNWALSSESGIVTDAASGFFLPNGARRSPDAAWISNDRIAGVAPESWHVCPEFVIELRSPSDRLRVLRQKMEEWIDNGAALGWLVDPDRNAVEIYRAGRLPEVLTGIDEIGGEGPVTGFILDLRPVWVPFTSKPVLPE